MSTVAVVCGSVRKLPDFIYLMHRLMSLRAEGAVSWIVVSTWSEETALHPELFQWLRASGVTVVPTAASVWAGLLESGALPPMVASMVVQDTQLGAAIDTVRQVLDGRQDVLVWKLRTDLIVARLDMFLHRLRRVAGDYSGFLGKIHVHHASTLELFDIADISYIVQLAEADRIGRLGISDIGRYARNPAWTEAMMFGAQYFRRVPLFGLVSLLTSAERQRMRGLAIQCLVTGARSPVLAALYAGYFRVLSNGFCLLTDGASPPDLKVEDYFRPSRPIPGLSPYRELNQVMEADYLLAAFRDATLTASTPFGEDVLSRLQIDPCRPASAADAACGPAAFMAWAAENLSMEPERLAAFRQDAERYIVAAVPEPPCSAEADAVWLRRLRVPEAFRLDDSILAPSAVARDAPAMARAVLESLAAHPAKLRYWANLLASMDIAGPVTSVMARLDPGFALPAPYSRATQTEWLDSAGVGFNSGEPS